MVGGEGPGRFPVVRELSHLLATRNGRCVFRTAGTRFFQSIRRSLSEPGLPDVLHSDSALSQALSKKSKDLVLYQRDCLFGDSIDIADLL